MPAVVVKEQRALVVAWIVVVLTTRMGAPRLTVVVMRPALALVGFIRNVPRHVTEEDPSVYACARTLVGVNDKLLNVIVPTLTAMDDVELMTTVELDGTNAVELLTVNAV